MVTDIHPDEDLTKREVAARFMKRAKELYPNVGEPGAVYVLHNILGWSWDDVEKTAVDGFSRQSYRRFLFDDNGKRMRREDGRVAAVTRKWTNEEKRILRDWWWLLGL